MKYKFKDYGNGNVEVSQEDLDGTPFEYLAVRCSDFVMHNMTDAELVEDDMKYNGDGREMKFNIFVGHNICLSFTYEIFGLDVRFGLQPKLVEPNSLDAINEVIITVNDYFKDKTTKDISEAFYKKFEHEILERILDYDSKRIA